MKRFTMRFARRAGISCARVHELVQSYLDGELDDGPERDRLIAHLDLCEHCGVEAEVLARIKASLKTPVPPDAVERLTRFASSLTADDGGS
jgi:anti-sigma factor RsiW